MSTIVVIGATGQVGRVVAAQAVANGERVRAVTRSASRARRVLPDGVDVVEADATDPASLSAVLAGADAVVLTHGTDSDGRGGETFHEIVVAVLQALGDSDARVSLMTTMNASHSAGPSAYDFIEWKRRAERVLRASGRGCTIVRPGWFGHQGARDLRLDLRQGDLTTGTVGVDVAHVAQVLLAGAGLDATDRRTVEVFSVAGEPVTDVAAALRATDADQPGGLDAVHDTNPVDLADEPASVRAAIRDLGA